MAILANLHIGKQVLNYYKFFLGNDSFNYSSVMLFSIAFKNTRSPSSGFLNLASSILRTLNFFNSLNASGKTMLVGFLERINVFKFGMFFIASIYLIWLPDTSNSSRFTNGSAKMIFDKFSILLSARFK